MKNYRIVLIIGVLEILIGGLTLWSNFLSILFSFNHKPVNVFLFVIITGTISTLIGIGILKFNKTAYNLLIYFSTIIIGSKILLFLNIIQLNGALDTIVPSSFKNIVSVAYHGFVIYYLKKQGVKEVFHS